MSGQYRYQAYDSAGQLQSGQIGAESERDAVRVLQGRKLIPVKVTPARESAGPQHRGRIRQRDLVDFTNGLRTLTEARVPIDKALRLLEGITESPAMRELVASLRREVKEGRSLADAMEARPDVFSRMYVNIVRAGEEGGILHQLLPNLTAFLESSAQTRQAIVSAMVYPVVLVVVGVISVALLLVFVVPQFAVMFEDAGTEVPPSAQFLLDLSAFLQGYGWLFVIALLAIGFGWRWLDRDPELLLRKHRFLLRLPLLGRLILHQESALFARTLGALLGSGIPLLRALRIARDVLRNTELTRHLRQVEEEVRGGSGLGLALERTQVFPNLLHQLVTVGEESGRTASILLQTAGTFDADVRNQMARLVAALQPALIILLAVAVGGITITMLAAVFSMNAVEF